jgi:RHS repeat-associated protein
MDANGWRSAKLFDSRGLTRAEQDQMYPFGLEMNQMHKLERHRPRHSQRLSGAFTTFSHDPVGNTILRVDARSWATTYTMDVLNRTAVSAYMDGTITTNTWNQIGQQTTMQDTTGITSYLYDLNQRQIAVQNPTGINLTYAFDAIDNRVTMQDIGGTTSYVYDAQSRNTVIVNPLNERTSIQYDGLDREYRRVLANGGSISHTWDAAGRETLIQNISAAGVAQAVFTNTYSATNNRLTVQELDGTRVTFGYDGASQLTLEQRNGAQAYNIGYSYDGNGNRLTQSNSGAVTAYQYNAANAQVLITPPTGAPTTQTFDPVGNLTIQNTGGALTTQTWSPENRMLSISNPDGSGEQSTYSAHGLRKSRTSGGITTNFTWDQQNLLLETDTSNVVQARYTDFPGYWGGLTSQNRSGTSSFYGYDSQGSVRILTNSAGAVTDTYVYTAFGVELLNGSGTVNPFRYVGLYGYYITFINLYYVRARWLDTVKGRWDSRDPIWPYGGFNAYQYANSSPVDYRDPTGLYCNGILEITTPSLPIQIGPVVCGVQMTICYKCHMCGSTRENCGQVSVNLTCTTGLAAENYIKMFKELAKGAGLSNKMIKKATDILKHPNAKGIVGLQCSLPPCDNGCLGRGVHFTGGDFIICLGVLTLEYDPVAGRLETVAGICGMPSVGGDIDFELCV